MPSSSSPQYKFFFLNVKYCLPLDKEGEALERSEVLLIGSGGAGLRAAIELSDLGVDVLVVGKSRKRDAHTIMATGGINAALGNMDPKDSWQLHAADTIRDGGYINDTAAVIRLCKNAPHAVSELLRWGAKFNKDKSGKVLQRFFGAATYRRACFAGDHTGKEILNVLVDQVLKRKIRFRSEVYITSLLQKNGRVNGAIGVDLKTGKAVLFHAKAVVLATGGHSRVFSRSSSRFWENNGDGIGLAYAAGAKFVDMEMFQYHPTGMVWPEEAAGLLVTEAVRGEGGILTNARGERFMRRYDPNRRELSARDIVARAIYDEIEAGRGTRHSGVWLDITHRPKRYILERLPKVYKEFKKYAGIDISRSKMEVAPTAHYSMGGILVDHVTGKTSVKNLYAIGEVTGAVHGANRLGGNSLAEIMVFGRLTGQSIAKGIRNAGWLPLDGQQVRLKTYQIMKLLNTKGHDPITVKKQIQEMMWDKVGVVKNGRHLKQALGQLQVFKDMKLATGTTMRNNKKLIAALDIQNMLPTCEMIIRSALFRKESRGAHYRTDYPKTLAKWKKNIICDPTAGGLKLSTRPVQKVPKEVSKHLKKKIKIEAHLLE
jgi:succinate dehydrogenase / fumarate reductase flavoprotein subunit